MDKRTTELEQPTTTALINELNATIKTINETALNVKRQVNLIDGKDYDAPERESDPPIKGVDCIEHALRTLIQMTNTAKNNLDEINSRLTITVG